MSISYGARCRRAAVIAVFLAATVGLCPAGAAQGAAGVWAGIGNCDIASRRDKTVRCLEPGPIRQAQLKPGSDSIGSWKLVRTPNPSGGADMVSVMHTADILRSDADLAGLTVRCGAAGAEVLLILSRPLSPSTRPMVVVGAGGTNVRLEAKVVPPFVTLLLPGEAEALARGPWLSAPEISVEIKYDQGSVRGVIPVGGLSPALQLLAANCPK
jgi:hypothetical protein